MFKLYIHVRSAGCKNVFRLVQPLNIMLYETTVHVDCLRLQCSATWHPPPLPPPLLTISPPIFNKSEGSTRYASSPPEHARKKANGNFIFAVTQNVDPADLAKLFYLHVKCIHAKLFIFGEKT
jgi:hypothetical protein